MLRHFKISTISAGAKFLYSTIFIVVISPIFDENIIAQLFTIIATHSILLLVFDFGYSVSLSHREKYDPNLVSRTKIIISMICILMCLIVGLEISILLMFSAAISSIALTEPQILKSNLDFKLEARFYLIQSTSLIFLVTICLCTNTDVNIAYFVNSLLLIYLFGKLPEKRTTLKSQLDTKPLKTEITKQSTFWLYTVLLHGGNAIELILAQRILSTDEFLTYGYSQRALFIGIFSLPIIYNVLLPLKRRHASIIDNKLYLKTITMSGFICALSVFSVYLFYLINDINVLSANILAIIVGLRFIAAWCGFYILYTSAPLIRALLVALQIVSIYLFSTHLQIDSAEVFLLLSSCLILTYYGIYIIGKYVTR